MFLRVPVLTVLVVLVLTPVLLAERPSSPEVRDKEATHILVGRVKNVYERKVGTIRVTTHYLVELEIQSTERGEGFAKGDLAYIRCFQVTKRPPNDQTTGAGGHGPIPKAGQRVRAWVAKGKYGPLRQEDNGTTAVYPNGFVILR